MKAFLRQIRISPKKANLVAGMVRRKPVTEALTFLHFANKKAATILEKLIASATANAENNFAQKRADLIVSKILVTKGPTYKRGVPISRGRMAPILKRTSHITVEVAAAGAVEVSAVAPKKAVKPVKEVAPASKKTEEKAPIAEKAEKKEVKKAPAKKPAAKKAAPKASKPTK